MRRWWRIGLNFSAQQGVRVCECASPSTSEWQLSISRLTVTATLSHLAVMMRLHRTPIPHQQFESNLWFLLSVGNKADSRPPSSLKSLKTQGVFLSRVHLRTCVWRLLCVIFIDRCWKAGVSQSQEIRWERSHSLCASQYCDFKAIDSCFCEQIPQFWHVILSALSSVPHLVSILSDRPTAWFYLAATKKEKRERCRGWIILIWCSFLSAVSLSFLLTVCLSTFYLTLPNPRFLSCSPIYHHRLHPPLHGCVSSPTRAQVIVIMNSSGLLPLHACFTLFWRPCKLFPRQPFTFIGTLNPPIKSPKLALWAQLEGGRGMGVTAKVIYNAAFVCVCLRVCVYACAYVLTAGTGYAVLQVR